MNQVDLTPAWDAYLVALANWQDRRNEINEARLIAAYSAFARALHKDSAERNIQQLIRNIEAEKKVGR